MTSDRNSRRQDSDGPRRFIRSWLSFDDTRPARLRRLWALIATVLFLLLASALLATFGRHA